MRLIQIVVISISIIHALGYIKRTPLIKSRLYIKMMHYIILINRLNSVTAPWRLRASIECKLIPLRHIACEIHPPLGVSISKAFHKHSSKYSVALIHAYQSRRTHPSGLPRLNKHNFDLLQNVYRRRVAAKFFIAPVFAIFTIG